MKKLIIRYLIVSLLFISMNYTTAQNYNTSITGTVKNQKFSQASLYLISTQTKLIAQSLIDTNGTFSISFNADNKEIYKLQFDNKIFLSLIITKGDQINIVADGNNIKESINVTGSKETILMYESNKKLRIFEEQLDSLSAKFYDYQYTGIDSMLNIISEEYQNKEEQRDQYLVDFINENSTSFACLFIIEKLPIEKFISTYVLLDDNLFPTSPENAYVLSFHKKVTAYTKLAIGSPAPEISLPDPKGNIISLSSLKGQIVLIDFWASWCGPCRMESPNLVKLYKKFHEKGFEILGVSLDKNKSSWTYAIQNDNLTWLHVSDLKFWQCEAARAYDVTTIPHTVLIDAEGNILAKGLRGKDLENKLSEIFNQ